MSQQKDRGKKLLKTMIIQDDHNLVVVEPSS